MLQQIHTILILLYEPPPNYYFQRTKHAIPGRVYDSLSSKLLETPHREILKTPTTDYGGNFSANFPGDNPSGSSSPGIGAYIVFSGSSNSSNLSVSLSSKDSDDSDGV